MKKKLTTILIILIALFSIVLLSSNVIIDILWFKEVGYLSVYLTKAISIFKLFIPIFIVMSIILYLYSRTLFKDIVRIVGHTEDKFKKFYYGVTFGIAAIVSISISTKHWYSILQFQNSVSFNETDPLFNNDISFYVFKLPLIEVIYNILLSLVMMLIVITIVMYFMIKTKYKIEDFKSNIIHIDKSGKKRFSIIAFAIFIMISGAFILKSYSILYSPRGVVYGAGYTDYNVTLLFYRVIIVLSLISAIISIVFIYRSKVKYVFILGGVVIAAIVLEPITAQITQNFFVKSNELEFEKKYISYNIDSTRKAFNIANMEEKSFEPKYNLDAAQIEENKDIIDNLRVNSVEPVLSFYDQVQSMKNYYNFHDIDTDRYNINGKDSQVFVSVREIDTSNINTWQNKHLIYTHGYGTVMSNVNSVTSEGQPNFVMSDLPTKNDTDIVLDNPRTYFGESSNDYIIVNTNIDEMDYPNGDENQGTKYDGTAGIKLTPLNKLLFSIREGSSRILFSQDITSESKIILNKNIVERVNKIAPFLMYDKDPYVVIDEGRLFWIIDAYTTTNRYPYSKPYDGVNYIRNSVKVVVDAYNGTTDFYIVDNEDPIVKSYSKIFKGLFKPLNEMSDTLKEHFRYPETLFDLQCDVLGKYHITNPQTFFTQDDMWQVSTGDTTNTNDIEEDNEQSIINNDKNKEPEPTTTTEASEALYLMTKLPGEDKPEMILSEYFNVLGKQNMVSMVAARMDGDNYGKLVMYKFPQQKTIYSPMLFNNKIMQDKDITSQIKLWEGRGSQVLDGDIIILPINDSLLYLKTIYLKANSDNAIPEVKKIVISDGIKIVSGDTVEEALQMLFNYNGETTDLDENNPGEVPGQGNDTVISGSDAKEAKRLYDEALNALKEGNWNKYGENIDKLGELINKINGVSNQDIDSSSDIINEN